MKCYYCDKTDEVEEMRPYGPGGAGLCFPCMKSSPEREEAASKMFLAQLDACGSVVILDGSSSGPRPGLKSRLN